MNIRIIAVGKVKEDYLKLGISEYINRLKPYVNISIIEVRDEGSCDRPNNSEIDKIKNIESERVFKIIKDQDYVINLDLNKKEFLSEEFAKYLQEKITLSNSNLTFIIGGSYGLSDSLKKRANDSISLSKMTFLHQMTRLILLEQIYRAFKINRNEVYHK